ncbi:hypothetical protein ACX5I6_05225 [Arthrobacter sp. MMS24-T111]
MTAQTAAMSPAEHFQRVLNWCQLSRTEEVTVHRPNQNMITGRIDMVALDGSVFWIILDDGKGRTMIHRNDNAKVYRA